MSKLLNIILFLFILSSNAYAADFDPYNFPFLLNYNTSGTTMYIQKGNVYDGWYIKAIDQSGGSGTGRTTYHYDSGNTQYLIGWSNKETLVYKNAGEYD